ncbi:MAG: hypothetical protein IKC95_06805 [Oscillospiraceae bacterium]|nr:hypothetical protein [Oscillospiraceae bacterium]
MLKEKRHLWTGLVVACCLLVLILDSKTALQGAQQGILLCIQTVIPSLFPFFVLSTIMNKMLIGVSSPVLRPIASVCGVPKGAESLLLLGFLGGYPVGAKCVSEAYAEKAVSSSEAKRLLGFCSNAGPAFIFGMGSCIFDRKSLLWVLWAIHIVSAFLVGSLLPNKRNRSSFLNSVGNTGFANAVEQSIKAIATVCGWVVIFRVIISFLQHWILWIFPVEINVFIFGILELSNGFCALSDIADEHIRFLLCSFILSFGGLCVTMQTVSVTKKLGIGMYFPGKILQACISLMLATILGPLLFKQIQYSSFDGIILLFCFSTCTAILYIMHHLKNKKKSSRNLALEYV